MNNYSNHALRATREAVVRAHVEAEAEGEQLMGEKLYLDHATILRQIGMTFR